MIQTRYLFGLPMLTFNINEIQIEAILDTGFNGALSLPNRVVDELCLPNIGKFKTVLADGNTIETDAFVIQTNWFGKEIIIDVISTNSDIALIGMEMINDLTTILSPNENILQITQNEKRN